MSDAPRALASRYGEPRIVTCTLPSLDFPPLNERKHGEVCMAILRRSGRFLLHTKKSYPNAIMRLPTGGIKEGEDIEHALMREIWEETNLDVDVDRFVATVRYDDGAGRSSFQTHMFLCRELGGVLQSNDPAEKITAWAEATADELPRYADELRAIVPSWGNWGRFRAAALDILADYLAGRSG